MRTQAEWNVETHMPRLRAPIREATRSRISPAALLVKVIARIWPGLTSRAARRWAIRCASTRVLPDPAPATINSGAPWWMTAARCWGLRPSRSASGARLFTGSSCRPAPSGGESPPASTQVGTPRASTSALAAAGLSSGREKSPKRVLIVSSSLRRTGDENAHPLPWDLGARTGISALGGASCRRTTAPPERTGDIDLGHVHDCLLYTSDAADEEDSVDLGGRR